MVRSDSVPTDRTLAIARRVLRVVLYTAGVCLAIGFSVLVLIGTRLLLQAVIGSRTLSSFIALVVFAVVIALPVYLLAVREGADDLLP